MDFEGELAEIATLLATYAEDFDVQVVDMFDEVIAFDDPEDDSVNAEVHYLIGFVACAASFLELEPVELVEEYREDKNDGATH